MSKATHHSRRHVLRTMAFVGLSGLVARPAIAQATGLPLTPLQTMGPFYPIARPLEDDMDLTRIAGRTGRAAGQVIELTGRVLTPDGAPVPGARVEVWQANREGRYDHPSDPNPAPLDPNFQGFGVQQTDEEGRYRFLTIKPGAYAVRPDNPDDIRPPHIHFDVFGRKDRLVTQMYFPGEPGNTRDRIFRSLGHAQSTVMARPAPPLPDMEANAIHLQWDIVLAKG